MLAIRPAVAGPGGRGRLSVPRFLAPLRVRVPDRPTAYPSRIRAEGQGSSSRKPPPGGMRRPSDWGSTPPGDVSLTSLRTVEGNSDTMPQLRGGGQLDSHAFPVPRYSPSDSRSDPKGSLGFAVPQRVTPSLPETRPGVRPDISPEWHSGDEQTGLPDPSNE